MGVRRGGTYLFIYKDLGCKMIFVVFTTSSLGIHTVFPPEQAEVLTNSAWSCTGVSRDLHQQSHPRLRVSFHNVKHFLSVALCTKTSGRLN